MLTRIYPAASVLLETKLFVPRRRRQLVLRSRLSERLSQALEAKLTLVSAPPGFGKTTLVAEWLAEAHVEAAWLSLDHGDNNQAFWSYLVAALQTVQPGLGESTAALLQSPQPPPIDALLATLLDELNALNALPGDLVLVLDDYHVIDDRAIHDGMAFLLDHLPPRLHLIVVSRADPPLPLARLRGRGELVEIRAADLRFSSDEATAYFNDAMGLHLTSADVAALEARTEGWIAALQLAALSILRRDDPRAFIADFAGDDRYIVDYLVEEVLEQQPARVRDFLLRTSILDRLSGPLCDAVSADGEGGQAALEALDRANLFVVQLDNRRHWWRYHHLFADVLRAHLVDEQPALVADLHRRASEWYADNAEPAQAIHHALAAHDDERAAALIERAARATLRGYRPAVLVEWLAALPPDLVRTRPVLGAYYAFALLGLGELDAAESLLRDAERCLDGTSDSEMVIVEEAELRSLAGMIALAWAFRAQALGDVATTLELAARAHDLMPEGDHVWRAGAGVLLALAYWMTGDLETAQAVHDAGVADLVRSGDIRLAISAVYDGAELRKARGRLIDAQQCYARAFQLADRHGGSGIPGLGDLHLGLGDLYREWDDLDAARAHLQLADDLGRRAPLPQTPARSRVASARLRQAEGDLDDASELLDQAERLYLRGPVPEIRPIGALQARLWLVQGRLEDALAWARRQQLSDDDDLDYAREFAHITLARTLLARAAHDGDRRGGTDALALLGRLLATTEAHGRTDSTIDILVALALAHRARGDTAAAVAAVGRALALAEPHGYVRTFVDEGEPMRDLLRHVVAGGVGGAYARRLLGAFEQPAPTTPKGLAESLTPREVEILRLVAIGMRNQEIAEQLVISLPTVKRHIANTYGKLGANHRTEAIARARALGML
jgi:LuxR family maltose regulon positive regulatory protein